VTVDVSVILPTHAPHPGRLARTLAGLRAQTWPRDRWELLVVDNASPDPAVLAGADLCWHPRARLLCEGRLGLAQARLAGFRQAAGEFLVLVDDDNVLDPGYLEEVVTVFGKYPTLGAIGGKSLPEWEAAPPSWVHEFAECLALRDRGDREERVPPGGPPGNPPCSPVGAGMALRRAAAAAYVAKAADGPTVPDRCGRVLSSGGDNDIVLTVLAAGWEVGYDPQLRLTHLIPAGRLTRDYLGRLNRASSRSWVGVLALHGIRPWPRIARWTVPARKLRAWWRCRAWRDPAAYVRWQGACGQFEGQAELDV
jgi:glycosyltransferase involved in cell wall biosynthesis